MKFGYFQKQRQQLLAERAELRDCAESNVYRALASLIPPLAAADQIAEGEKMHRCHLASQWTEHFGFPAEDSARALVSCGIRHSLAVIFSIGAESNSRFWIPADNYPAYRYLAASAGATTRPFVTLPEPIWPAAKSDSCTEEFLLITNPLKPRGRWLNESDLLALEEWLEVSERRRLIIDAVYDLGETLSPGTLRLIAGGRTILLHSLTKGWLQPRLFGVALVPERDLQQWLPGFRESAPPQKNLATARQLLGEYRAMPQRVASTLAAAGDALFCDLPIESDRFLDTDAAGYLFPVKMAWRELLEQNILGIPATAFGSDREDVTILSSLSLIR